MDIEKTIKYMTIEDKVSFLTGKNFWETKDFAKYGIPSIRMSDGPHGLRYQDDKTDNLGVNESLPATCFPTAVTSASSWNRELYYEVGKAIGEEALSHGVSIVLGPGCNIKRNPLNGRNFEYLSEDPYLSGTMASSYIKGQKSTGVMSCVKHFAANNQEYKRFISNSIIDERALNEIYLKAFMMAVKDAKPASIMCSYNKINGTYSSDNKWLLTNKLRNEWGFDGIVITDWGALSDHIEAIRAGLDLNMPGGSDYMYQSVIKAIKDKRLDIEDVDKCVRRILNTISMAKTSNEPINYSKHHELAIKMAQEGAVLLKNEGNILPLTSDDKILLLGDMAENIRYQGAGSSHINPVKLDNIKDNLVNAKYIRVVDNDGKIIEDELKEAKNIAKDFSKVVIVAGLVEILESEGFDRNDMSIPDGHLRMINEITKVNPNVVVVLLGGSAMELPFNDDVKAILYMGLGGEGLGTALKHLLYGEVNPSGKLTESWPVGYGDVISKDTFGKIDALYTEGIYVGYRYYDKANVKVRYPFGHGLSYTVFDYSDLKIDGKTIRFKIRNTGNIKGKEVVELYIGNPDTGIYRPVKELRDFIKIELEKGEEKEVCFEINDSYFETYDEGFKVYEGDYKIMIGSSLDDIRLEAEYHVDGLRNIKKDNGWYDHLNGQPSVSDFEKILGRKIEYTENNHKGSYTMNNSCLEMKNESLIMKIQYIVTENIIAKQFGGIKDMNNPAFKMMMISATDSPLRVGIINSQGLMKNSLGEGLLEMSNGHYIKGIKKMMERGAKNVE